MRPGKFIALLIVALVLCVAAIIAYKQQNASVSSTEKWRGQKVFADVSKKIEDVRRIEYTKASDKLELVRDDENQWHAVSNEGYQADNNRINELIFNLTDLTILDRITEDKAKYAKFGVGKEIGEGGNLKLSGKSGILVNLIMGKRQEVPFDPDTPSMGSGGYYMRVNSDPYVYLTKNSDLWALESKVSRWAKTAILSVPRDDVTDIKIDTPTSGSAHLAWDDGALKLDTVPAGMQQKDSEVQSVRDGLSAVRFEDVFSPKSGKAKGIDLNTSIAIVVKNGTIYHVKGGQKADSYITLSSSYGQPLFTDDDKATTTSLAEAQKKANEAKAAVPGFNKQQGQWIYEMDSYLFGRLVRDPKSLIEPKVAAKAEDKSSSEVLGAVGQVPVAPVQMRNEKLEVVKKPELSKTAKEAAAKPAKAETANPEKPSKQK